MISKRDLNSLSRKRNQPVKRAASIKPKPAPPVSPQEPEDPDYVPFGVKGVLGATERLLAVSRGLDEPDNRDSYGFKRIWGVDKHLGERIRLDAGKIRRQQIRTAAKLRSLKGTHPFAFDTYTRGLILGDPGEANPLSSPLEEINPLHLLEQARRITQMGPGGIQSSQAITADAQNVHASQFGFVSSVAGPECHSEDTDVLTARGWLPWPKVLDSDEFACRVDGSQMFLPAERIVRERFQGSMILIVIGPALMQVTPTHRIWLKYPHEHGQTEMDTAADAYGGMAQQMNLGDLGWVTITEWAETPYAGIVYCATVPGGLLFTRMLGGAGVWSGNSEKIGIDARLAHGVRIGSDGQLYQQFRNARTKQLEWMTPSAIENSVVRIPD